MKKLNVQIFTNVGVRRTATFMILGSMYKSMSILRGKTGLPNELDLNEPERVAESVELMNLKHVVITAVARDDLRDQGSNVYAETVRKVRERNPFTTIEILPSDMVAIMKPLKH